VKLLIVDDNATNLRLLRAQLEAEGHEVVEAANGMEGLRLLRKGAADGVISDILMPEMDGYRFCIEVRGDPALRELPFVLYTSTYNSPADRQLALNAGADAYISKPAPVPVILEAIAKAMDQKRKPAGEQAPGGESDVLKRYSEVLVRKLEDKNLELEASIESLSIAHDEARQADAMQRLVFENVPVGITITGAEGAVISANTLIARMLGYASVPEALEAIGNRAAGVYADPAVRAAYVDRLRREGTVRNFETQLVRKDGSRFWAALNGRVIPGEKGGSALLVTIIDDITLRREQEHRIERLSRVKDMQSGINSAVAHVRERKSLLEEVCRIAVSKGGMRAAWVGWHDAQARRIRPIASAGILEGFLELVNLSTNVPPEQEDSMAVQVIQQGRPRVTNDLAARTGHAYRKEALERGYLAMMHLPLMVGDTTEGVLILYAPEIGFFDEEEVRLLEGLAADVSFALESLEKSERLEYLAYYDPLTGLPNRSLFQDRLSQSLHSRGGDSRLIAVVLLDLQRFRRVNETFGRTTGDELLRRAGARLKSANDSAARIGVDMFGLVLRGARTAVELNRTLEAIVDASFSEPFALMGNELRVSCRAGVAVFPNDGTDADALLRNAEAALRRSKREAERILFYAPEMNARAAEALAIETRLRRATEKREFVLHYQPKVNLASGLIAGLEALIRWQEPGTGLVPPGHFIPVLEETGLIVEVGRWAMEQTFADLRAWAKAGIKVPRVAVNVSAIQLQRKDFVDVMIGEIERGGDNPEWLELEITESLVMRNVEDSTRKLSILRGMGVTIAIDDFGTGYSSLAYLARLPVDKLKIDRSFISAVATTGEATTLVTTMIALAHGLKLSVVAEGVETEDQARLLHLFSCDEAQGYFYSKPIPAADIEKLLRAGGKLPATS
jgi:diguanylate cyclase (GGDEF)-like protein/PAS domain S-box-containing protein